jgi:ribosomal protein S18 acetylase RimI-like enzyme
MPEIYRKQPGDNHWIREDLIKTFGSAYIISTGREYNNAQDLDGFIAREADNIAGVLLFSYNTDECELVYLHVLEEGKGIAKMLIKALIDHLQGLNVSRLIVVTTNDNIPALKLYQQTGFRMTKIYPNAMEKVRAKKPMVPRIGHFGIPLRDMIEFEYQWP